MSRWFHGVHGTGSKLLGGGPTWGYVRLLPMAGFVLLFAILSQWMWAEPGAEPIPLFSQYGWRYWVPALAALAGGLLVASAYIRRLYRLPSLRLGFRYLFASVTSIKLPVLNIHDGKPDVDVGGINLVEEIGGPGYLNIRPGSALVVESLNRPTHTFGAGRHFLSRLEHIREVISLADQHGLSENVTCNSKDGLEVNVQRVQYRYRLLSSHRPSNDIRRTMQDPYPFLPRAALDLAYRRAVGPDGIIPWDSAVRNAVEGVVTGHISTNWFDRITAPLPEEKDPRAEINKGMESARKQLKDIGTDLLWFDIGNFTPASPIVEDQRVETWGAKWIGSADVEDAKADAQRLVAEELGRAEAQADLINSLVRALEQVSPPGDARPNLHSLIVLRTAQLLETMVESSKSGAAHTPPSQPPSVALARMLTKK